MSDERIKYETIHAAITRIKHETIHAAMVAAFGEMPDVDRDGVNPHFQSRYTTLGAMVRAVRPVLARHGLVLIQVPAFGEGCDLVGIATTIRHESGESVDCGTVVVPTGKATAHGIGSAMTYARRYGLAAALGIVDQDDDDGNAATAAATKPSRREPANTASGGAQGFRAAVAAAGAVAPDDINELCNKVATRLGIDKATATQSEWAEAIGVVRGHADDLLAWVGASPGTGTDGTERNLVADA